MVAAVGRLDHDLDEPISPDAMTARAGGVDH
jgi:hypothetical protein